MYRVKDDIDHLANNRLGLDIRVFVNHKGELMRGVLPMSGINSFEPYIPV